MIAVEVFINGNKVCTAGAEDLAVLTASITASGQLGTKTVHHQSDDPPNLMGRVGGLTSRGERSEDVHCDWYTSYSLEIGDTMEIRLVDTTEVDEPIGERPRKK